MTIYDIAKEAGVSASTVSRVINGKEGIKKETREKIKNILEKSNYIPNDSARGLVMQSTKLIGILIEDIRVSHHTDAAYFIEKELSKSGYLVITLNTGFSDKKKAESIMLLSQRRVEGMILIGSMFGSKKVEESIERNLSNIPVIIVNGYIDAPNVYSILIDEKTGVYNLTKLFLDKGKTNIAFVSDYNTPSCIKKIEGYEKAMKECGYEIRVYKNIGNTLEAGKQITKSIIEENLPLDGIIYSVDILAVGGIKMLNELGKNIPDEIAVAGIDNTVYAEISYPSLTSIDNKLKESSIKAASILVKCLNGKNREKSTVLYTDIIRRSSL